MDNLSESVPSFVQLQGFASVQERNAAILERSAAANRECEELYSRLCEETYQDLLLLPCPELSKVKYERDTVVRQYNQALRRIYDLPCGDAVTDVDSKEITSHARYPVSCKVAEDCSPIIEKGQGLHSQANECRQLSALDFSILSDEQCQLSALDVSIHADKCRQLRALNVRSHADEHGATSVSGHDNSVMMGPEAGRENGHISASINDVEINGAVDNQDNRVCIRAMMYFVCMCYILYVNVSTTIEVAAWRSKCCAERSVSILGRGLTGTCRTLGVAVGRLQRCCCAKSWDLTVRVAVSRLHRCCAALSRSWMVTRYSLGAVGGVCEPSCRYHAVSGTQGVAVRERQGRRHKMPPSVPILDIRFMVFLRALGVAFGAQSLIGQVDLTWDQQECQHCVVSQELAVSQIAVKDYQTVTGYLMFMYPDHYQDHKDYSLDY